MRLAEWARLEGVHPKTAYKWWREGKLPYPARQIGTRTIVIDVPEQLPVRPDVAVLYARVSSADQKDDLTRQVARLSEWAAQEKLLVGSVVSEVGSGMNGRRPKLRKVLSDPDVTVIVVEHRDRFGRMNTELVEAALNASGRRLLVIEPGEVADDLVRDVTEVLVSFCGRLYGQRSARRRASVALAAAGNVDG